MPSTQNPLNRLSTLFLLLPATTCAASRLTLGAFKNAKSSSLHISLDAAGLVALADLSTIAERTAITGTSSFLDILLLAPGIHRQQSASGLNGGELPATAALTTGYVFRIENQATVHYLQKVGVAGKLVTVRVEPAKSGPSEPLLASVLYLLGPLMTVASIVLMIVITDWWGLAVLGTLMLARLCNVLVIRRRAQAGWKGASEPGVAGDLLVLLSQDRWIRLQGMVDDLKAVASGQWLHDPSSVESFVVAASTLMVFMVAALAGNASSTGSLILLCLLLGSVAALGLSNSMIDMRWMMGRVLTVAGPPKYYRRRLDLVEELIQETGRNDWAIGLGMVVPKKGEDGVRATM